MFKDVKKEISGGAKDTTNNIMEVTAVIEALKLLKWECEIGNCHYCSEPDCKCI